jgi:hypothetical protein
MNVGWACWCTNVIPSTWEEKQEDISSRIFSLDKKLERPYLKGQHRIGGT